MKIEVGDKVKVLAKLLEWKGNVWVPEMDKAVGKVGVVVGINFMGDPVLEIMGMNGYAFPVGCVKIIEKCKRDEEFRLNINGN